MFTGERPDPAKHPRPEFARMLTSDPQFARATVNLLWSEMFGVGIVEPVFAFDLARSIRRIRRRRPGPCNRPIRSCSKPSGSISGTTITASGRW